MPLHHVVTCPMQAPGKFFLDILLSSQINYYRNWPAWWCPTYQSLSIKPDVIWWEVQCDRTMPFWRVRYFTSICDVHSARLPLMWTSEIAERGFSCWFLALNQLVPMELVRLLDGVVLCFSCVCCGSIFGPFILPPWLLGLSVGPMIKGWYVRCRDC